MSHAVEEGLHRGEDRLFFWSGGVSGEGQEEGERENEAKNSFHGGFHFSKICGAVRRRRRSGAGAERRACQGGYEKGERDCTEFSNEPANFEAHPSAAQIGLWF